MRSGASAIDAREDEATVKPALNRYKLAPEPFPILNMVAAHFYSKQMSN